MRYGKLFYSLVRRRVMRRLMDQGKSRAEARRLSNALTTEEIDREASKVRLRTGEKDQVGGAFLDWILDNQDTILAVISLLVKLLLIFAAEEVAAKAKADTKSKQKGKK